MRVMARKPPADLALLGLALLALAYVLYGNAWLGDDAFISLRSVDNALNGHGLVWNAGERVQSYTHPLWLFVLIGLHALIADPVLVLHVAGLAFTAAAVLFLVFKVAASPRMALLAVALLAVSRAFIDFSSSGLENPLTHLLLLAFIFVLLGTQKGHRRRVFRLTLLFSLLAVNRMDSVLLVLPALVYVLFIEQRFGRRLLPAVLGGLAPLIAWEIFSLLYYGFPFPNTYYAKLHTGIPLAASLRQGWAYFANSLRWDSITLPIIALAAGLALHPSGDRRRQLLAVGIGLYLLYVLRIGGDFMAGRFFAAPFLVAVALIVSRSRFGGFAIWRDRRLHAALALVAVLALLNPYPPVIFSLRTQPYRARMEQGIADEKMVYYGNLGLDNYLGDSSPHFWQSEGETARAAGESPLLQAGVGLFGYHAGPEIYVIDVYTLGDPLRARLPAIGDDARIGHFDRAIPAGYAQTIEAGWVNRIEDPNLATYYSKLLLLIRDDLFAPNRLLTILEFNLGRYDYLLESYLAGQ